MTKSKRKAIKDLAQSKVVDISNYRELSKGQEAQKVALISEDASLGASLSEFLSPQRSFEVFENRFNFEQKSKTQDWDALILDHRSLGEEALQLCEKMKRQNQMDDLVVILLSNSNDKKTVREGLEKGCDEWVTRVEDVLGLSKLVDHYLS